VRSRLYTGEVLHHRVRPKRNEFRYRVWFLLVDLAELDDLDARLARFGHNRSASAVVRDADHGPRDGSPLRPWIDVTLGRAGVDLEGGPVFLLAFPRWGPFGFYPVSFWYCYHADGSLRAVLVEVRNTFGDHHEYLLHDDGRKLDLTRRPEAVKAMHVSPFIEMDARYRFHLTDPGVETEPGSPLDIRIYDEVRGELLLVAQVKLHAQELTDGSISRTLRRLGPMPLRAGVLILYQAGRLLAKGMRWLPRPVPPDEEISL
jgi:DUF1365 family protein